MYNLNRFQKFFLESVDNGIELPLVETFDKSHTGTSISL